MYYKWRYRLRKQNSELKNILMYSHIYGKKSLQLKKLYILGGKRRLHNFDGKWDPKDESWRGFTSCNMHSSCG